jgi:hypothetical protein
MPSSLSANPGSCSGRGLRLAFFLLLIVPTASAQISKQPAAKKAEVHRANEVTLAGLRPGRATLKQAVRILGEPRIGEQTSPIVWGDTCAGQMLSVDFDEEKRIQIIRVGRNILEGDCVSLTKELWKTGRGLRLGDSSSALLKLYGEPDSKSPSTRGGQPLELWYYAFDWAGPDVPQVMEVLCTREKDGQPGRVVEITLAAPSL